MKKNHLDKNDAALIASALRSNTNLEYLSSDMNSMTDDGNDALQNVVFDSSDLSSVAASHHSCCIATDDWRRQNNVSNKLGDSNQNKQKKIYAVLSARKMKGTNVYHFDAEFGDGSLNLVHKLLDCITLVHAQVTIIILPTVGSRRR